MIALALADDEDWGRLRNRPLDDCHADADGQHLYVMTRPSSLRRSARWRCAWCGAGETPLWLAAAEAAARWPAA